MSSLFFLVGRIILASSRCVVVKLPDSYPLLDPDEYLVSIASLPRSQYIKNVFSPKITARTETYITLVSQIYGVLIEKRSITHRLFSQVPLQIVNPL